MQYTQGFKDEASCIAFLEKPGTKKMVEKDIKYQLANVMTDIGEFSCATQRDAINKIMINLFKFYKNGYILYRFTYYNHIFYHFQNIP